MSKYNIILGGDQELRDMEFNLDKCKDLLALIELSHYKGDSVIIGVHGSVPFIAVDVKPDQLAGTPKKYAYIYHFDSHNKEKEHFWIEHQQARTVLNNPFIKEESCVIYI